MPVKSPPPHLRTRDSVPERMWTAAAALLPAVASALFFFGFSAFRTLVIAVASAVLAEMGMRKLFQKKTTLYDGSAVLTALLLALMLPPTLPSWLVALSSASALILGKEIFGGLGQNPFNPALVGYVFLANAFPESLTGVRFEAHLFAVLLGGLVLFGRRLIHWEIPLLYAAGVFLFSLALGRNGIEAVWSGNIFLAAFFLVTDPVTTPLTRTGERTFAFGSGLATVAVGWAYGILAMNALNPWLDQWFRPRQAVRRIL